MSEDHLPVAVQTGRRLSDRQTVLLRFHRDARNYSPCTLTYFTFSVRGFTRQKCIDRLKAAAATQNNVMINDQYFLSLAATVSSARKLAKFELAKFEISLSKNDIELK